MSYAGPASRTPRAPIANPELGLVRAKPRATALPSPPNRRAQSYTDDGSRTPIFVAGLAIGLAIGAGVALLAAPQTGRKTRKSLRRMSTRAARRGHDVWDDLRDEFRRYQRHRRYRRSSRNRDDASSL